MTKSRQGRCGSLYLQQHWGDNEICFFVCCCCCTKFVVKHPGSGGQTTGFHSSVYLIIDSLQWSHSKKAVGWFLGPAAFFVWSLHVDPLVSVGSLQVLLFPPTVQRHSPLATLNCPLVLMRVKMFFCLSVWPHSEQVTCPLCNCDFWDRDSPPWHWVQDTS